MKPTDPDTPVETAWSPAEETLPTPGATALTPEERAEAGEVAQRLRNELVGLVELLPEGERAASAMARALKIDRNICQRIMNATARGEADARMLVLLPGVQGLRDFLDAIARRIKKPRSADEIAAADAAVDRFEQLIDHLAGSQRKLRERLEADREIGDGLSRGPSDDLAARRALFRSAAEVVGRWSETWISVGAIRPAPGDPLSTEGVRLRGLIGHVSRPVAVPLELGFLAPPGSAPPPHVPAFAPLGEGPASTFLMPEYCTRPLPRVTSKAVGQRVAHVIDARETATPTPQDIVLVDRRSGKDKHPATLRPALGEVATLVTFPARRLVFDVWLHREIARRCLPSLELHLWGPQVATQHGISRWSTRFPGGPRLQLLGSGLEHAASTGFARHAEMTASLFGALGWDAGEFVGYRCDVAYPVWRAGYIMLFDFTGNELPAGGPGAAPPGQRESMLG
jgi:hypothetical protein